MRGQSSPHPSASRVRLRPANHADIAAAWGWLAEAVAAVDGRSRAADPAPRLDQVLQAFPEEAELLAITRDDGRAIGLLVLIESGAWTRVELLAIGATDRNLGLGAEAVYAAEQLFAGRPLLAGVPLENGLAIYFWLRAGYHPLYPSPQTAALPEGRIWMTRDAKQKRMPLQHDLGDVAGDGAGASEPPQGGREGGDDQQDESGHAGEARDHH